MDKNIVISFKTVFFSLLFFLVGYIIYRLGPIIAIILIAGLIAIALEHSIKSLTKLTVLNKPLPRSVAVILTYVGLIALISIVISIGVPPVSTQAEKLFQNLGQITQSLALNEADISITSLFQRLTKNPADLLSATVSVFSNIATIFTIIVISIYMSLDWLNIKRKFISLMPAKYKEFTKDTIIEVENSVGAWLKGEALLMCIVGSMSFIGLILLGIDYPLALGLIAGLLEAVPMIGPFIALVVAAIIGFSMAPVKGLAVILLFAFIQQIENNLIVPKVMQRVSGFSPLIILLALLTGGTLFGFVGILLAIPTTITLVVVLKRILKFSAGSE